MLSLVVKNVGLSHIFKQLNISVGPPIANKCCQQHLLLQSRQPPRLHGGGGRKEWWWLPPNFQVTGKPPYQKSCYFLSTHFN